MVTKVKNPEIHIKYQHVGSFVHFDGVAVQCAASATYLYASDYFYSGASASAQIGPNEYVISKWNMSLSSKVICWASCLGK